MEETPTTADDELLSMADMARYFGVSHAVPSNWKRRYEDFPVPVEVIHGGRSLHRFSDVVAFAARHGLPNGKARRKGARTTTCQVQECEVEGRWAIAGHTSGAICKPLNGFRMCDEHLVRRDLGYVVRKARQILKPAA